MIVPTQDGGWRTRAKPGAPGDIMAVRTRLHSRPNRRVYVKSPNKLEMIAWRQGLDSGDPRIDVGANAGTDL